MLPLSHILVLAQPGLIRRQVGAALETQAAPRRWWRPRG
jgi:hypothetical protein